jgi:hypothetical protein
MKLIKINYNNLAVKKPKNLVPEFFMFRRVFLNDDGIYERKIFLKKINGRFDVEPYYTNVFAEFSVDDKLLFYADIHSEETSFSNVLNKETGAAPPSTHSRSFVSYFKTARSLFSE